MVNRINWNVGRNNEIEINIGVICMVRHVCGFLGVPNFQLACGASEIGPRIGEDLHQNRKSKV